MDLSEHNVTNVMNFITKKWHVCKLLGEEPQVKRAAKIVSFVTIWLIGISMNSLIIHLVRKTKSLHKPMCYLMANMAVADIIVLCLGLHKWLEVLLADSSAWRIDGIVGTVTCKLYTLMYLVAPIVSLSTLLGISIERLRAVTSTIITPIKNSWFCALVVLCWLLPAGMYSYTLYAFDIVRRGRKVFCTDLFLDTNGWILYHYAFYAFMVALVTAIVFLNLLVVKKLNTSQQSIDLPEAQKRKRAIKFFRAVRMVIFCCLLFVVCWGPRSFLGFLDHLSEFNFSYCSAPTVFFVIELLFYTSFPLFPVIHFTSLASFRNALIKFIRNK